MSAEHPEEWGPLQRRQFGGERPPLPQKPIKPDPDRDRSQDEPFDLPPDKEAYYEGAEKAEEHQEKMKGMTAVQRRQYIRGLREGLQGPTPKRGDFDNPLKKDQPREPAPPKERNPMADIRKLRSLARKAGGRRR